MTSRRLVLPAAAASLLLLAGCAAPATLDSDPTASTTEPTLAMTAFQGEWSAPGLIAENAAATSVVAVDGINLAASGEVTPVSEDALAQLEAAHTAGLPAELMVGNFDAALGDFSEELAWATFADGAATTAAVAAVVDIVEQQGWDGVSVDLESLTARDSPALISFVSGLRASLGDKKTLSLSVQLQDSAEAYSDAGYDLEELSGSVDRLILMAYDQHGPWDPEPGPIGSLDWQRTGLEVLLEDVPADKVELGVAEYGYQWGTGSSAPLSVSDARDLAGDAAIFDEAAGEWMAALADGSTLWWSDAESFALRYALAEEYGLHGTALWVLELAEPIAP